MGQAKIEFSPLAKGKTKRTRVRTVFSAARFSFNKGVIRSEAGQIFDRSKRAR